MNRAANQAVLIRYALILVALIALLAVLSACNRDRSTIDETTTVANDSVSATVIQEQTDISTPATATTIAAATPKPEPTAISTSAEGVLTIWHSWAQRDGAALDAILADFETQFPGIQVEALFVAQNDLLQSYAQAIADGNGPDLILAPNWWLHELQTLGVIAPLDAAQFAQSIEAVWPAAADNLRINDRLLGIPVSYETVALYYDKSMVADDELPKSLDDLLLAANESPQNGIGLYAIPFHLTWGFPAFGAELFDSSGHAILDQSDGAAEFLRWLSQIDSLAGSFVDSDYGMLLDRFKRGEFAYFVDGPWAISELQQTLGDNLGVIPIPPGPSGQAQPWLYADAVYVNPHLSQEQLDLVMLITSHLTNQQSGAHLAQIAGRLPANSASELTANTLLQGFAKQAESADGMTHGPEIDAFWRYGGDMILKVLANDDDIQAVVEETAALINDSTGK